MFRGLLRGFFTVLGGLIGYEVYELISYFVDQANGASGHVLTNSEYMTIGVTFVLIFSLIFYRLFPNLTRRTKIMADNIETDLQGVSVAKLTGGIIGVVLGLAIGYLLTALYRNVLPNTSLYLTISIVIYAVMAFLGGIVGSAKISEFFTLLLTNINQSREKAQIEENSLSYSAKEKKKERIPKILDTSVIIDGRILEIMKTGFLEGPIVIPEFVLVELRHIADSSDSLKRNRGRRGLDILNKIQTEYGIDIYNTDSEKALKEIPEVDVKLLKLAQTMKGKVVTNDFNLNKVAAIKGIPVLNINELANAMKPMVIPGEHMTVTIIKQGKDPSQGVAYLDDGTMIVVEDGRKKVGETVDINVTTVLQTAAGRMIFGRIK